MGGWPPPQSSPLILLVILLCNYSMCRLHPTQPAPSITTTATGLSPPRSVLQTIPCPTKGRQKRREGGKHHAGFNHKTAQNSSLLVVVAISTPFFLVRVFGRFFFFFVHPPFVSVVVHLPDSHFILLLL